MYRQMTALAERLLPLVPSIKGEQHTKNVLIEPVLALLSYDITNPNDIITEHSCIATNKRDKVDYLLITSIGDSMVLEAKDCKYKLEEKHVLQLRKYVDGSKVPIGVLSNGLEYQFYTRTFTGTMDDTPFFTFSLRSFTAEDVELLSHFSKLSFSHHLGKTVSGRLKLRQGLVDYLSEQALNPSNDFLSFFSQKLGYTSLIDPSLLSEELKFLLSASIDINPNKDIERMSKSNIIEKESNRTIKITGAKTLADFDTTNTPGTKPTSLHFIDATYEVKTWADVLMSALDYCYKVGKTKDFILDLSAQTKGKKWIADTIAGMTTPRYLESVNLYVDTCASAVLHIKRLRLICQLLEITQTDVLINLK